MYADHLVQPWYDPLVDELPTAEVLDAHTHVGLRDPAGVTATMEEYLQLPRCA
ncbi:hypothetical protein [Nocardioides astragali]|uniref:Amidohydrolase n=1 Tax=Nocardioides astragali TaxID=1776736 RepID=A0ABW2N3J5_9ACTN|nr:hypothetical protein [Nocardioides astragali]